VVVVVALAAFVAASPLSAALFGVASSSAAAAPSATATAEPATTATAEPAITTAEPATTSGTLTPEDQAKAKSELTAPKAIVLGIVEGVTEFLPISSTGHLLVAQRWMGIGTTDATKDAADTYAIVIQAGAILAVLLLFWKRVWSIVVGMLGRDPVGRRIGLATLCAFAPAAVVGLLFEKSIKSRLLEPWPVVAAWAVGGLLLLWFGSRTHDRDERNATPLESISLRQGLLIGVAQILAMWPGTSRSLVTIAAALLVGLSLSAAVEFSFILGLVTLGAATVYEGTKNGSQFVDIYGWVNPLIGFVFAFIAAAIAVKWMVTYLQSHSLSIFGWYRLAAAAGTAALLLTGTI
jgi:undecaprenyl-diphosphatase